MKPRFSSSYTPGQTEQPQLPKEPSKAKEKIKNFFKRHWLTITVIVASSIASGVLVFLLGNVEFQTPTTTSLPPKPKPVYYAKLSGIEVPTEADVTRPITAIMIENSPDARPQSGLGQAEIVFEAIAEGGITRFLTLFQANQPQLVGPVRSIRIYYVDWLAPFQASVAHVGGSAEALAEVRSGKYRDIDQFSNSAAYWRSTDRYAPHNVYTNFERLNALNQQKGYTSSDPDMFERCAPKAVAEPSATNINVQISSALFNSSYSYDHTTNKYARSQAGAAHQDRESGTIQVDSVVAIQVDMGLHADGRHQDITTVGSGVARIFQNGEIITGVWKKPARFEQIKFYTETGEEIAINRGQVWIVAVPNRSGSVTWQ